MRWKWEHSRAERWQRGSHTFPLGISCRYSIGFFVGANYDAEIKIITSEEDDEYRAPHFEDTTYVKWRKMRVKTAMAELKRQ